MTPALCLVALVAFGALTAIGLVVIAVVSHITDTGPGSGR